MVTDLIAADTDSKNNSAVERVLGELQRLITVDGLRVGDGLPTEIDLARKLGTSRNTVREAMRTLKAYGIIETRPRAGAVLADNRHFVLMKMFAFGLEISESVFNDVQGFRQLIEQGIVDLVIENVTDRDIERLSGINDAMVAADSIQAAAALDFRFHHELVALAGIRTTYDVYSVLEPVMVRLLESGKSRLENRRDIASEHRNIIEALDKRDRVAYVYHVRTHLFSGLKYIRPNIRAVESQPG